MEEDIVKSLSVEGIITEKIETPLVDALEYIQNHPMVQFHIPGHTKGAGLYKRFKEIVDKGACFLDTTDEFNNIGTLHPATGSVQKSQELCAEALGGAHSYFLLNGSSVGNFALALTCTKPDSKVIIGRNCHRSVITGLVMTGAQPLWLTPQKHENWSVWGGVNPSDVEKTLRENNDVSMVWVTSPTYEGIVSDVEAIAQVCRKYNVTFVVDEAHGALWNFSDNMPQGALHLGADAVVHSMHKTAGSFSQSSVLTLSHNSRINPKVIENNLRLLHTTSPSVLLLASLDAARAYLSSLEGKDAIENAVKNANYIKNELKNVPKVRVLTKEDGFLLEPARVYLMLEDLCGRRLENILKIEYNIEIEASTDNGILALSNIGGSFEDALYFVKAVKEIAAKEHSDISYLEDYKFMPLLEPEIVMTPREAFYKEFEMVDTPDCVGRISADLIAECPPGIFVLAPGELISNKHLPYLANYKSIKVLK
ncbi:MAG: aminotransferase class V-fold PLP-dependent enzyme [Candidatus Gastranaerophilales bacterium]|nr:aminotransferase class V-fold PLP-dependent enzyme [Candidatus Gastranaerophilales bacterium]